jgi:RES domain-containing protein
MRAFRIADARFPIFDGTGAQLAGGRWNSVGSPVIYPAETFAGAVLEVLVNGNLLRMPKSHRHIEIDIPNDVSTERVPLLSLSGWASDGQETSRKFGDQWIKEARSAVLIVPNVVTGGVETNIVINCQHPDFVLVSASQSKPVSWEARLFRSQHAR